MRHKDRKLKSVSALVKNLREQTVRGAAVWFRGQALSVWRLEPSLARNVEIRKAENALIKRFKQNALAHMQGRPANEWEWLILMQHYRLPTRLLDWTESPLVALYFAVENSTHDDADGALWCLDPIALNQKANINFPSQVEVPAFSHDDILENYLPSRIASETTSELNPVAAIAVRNSPRISAQLGTFTITHRSHTPIEEIGDGKHVWKMVIPRECKSVLREELQHLRITRLALFPELDSVAEEARGVLS